MAQEEKRFTGIAITSNTSNASNPSTNNSATSSSRVESQDLIETKGFWESIREWWNNLADPSKIEKVREATVLRETRDNIVGCIVFAIIIICLRKMFPTLLVGLFLTELLAFILQSYEIRESICNGESYRDAQRRSARHTTRFIGSYFAYVLIFTFLAVWINHGAQWAQDFPILQTLATYQIEMVNEVLDFIANFPLKG